MTEPFKNEHVVVVGLGRSGRSAARLLARRGARVTANDVRNRDLLEDPEALANLEHLGVAIVCGDHPSQLFADADRIVVSPGVPPIPALAEAEAAGTPITSEVDLAAHFIEAPILGVTGTNGKSTVTSMLGAMCQGSGRETFVGGNLGVPLIEAVDTPAAGAGGLVVAELSSFQLERVERLRVRVAAYLNLSPDHLDRYDSFEAYAAAKDNIFAHQQDDDHIVVPDGDSGLLSRVARSRGRTTTFAGPAGAVRVVDGHLTDDVSGLSVPVEALQLSGQHNLDNACAAALMARLAGVGRSAIEAVLRTFSGLPHRMQAVDVVDGVRYLDDSKATNVGAAVASLAGLSGSGRVVLIAGGKDKGGSYQPLVEALATRARGAVLVGEAAPLLRAALAGEAYPVATAEDMTAAVAAAASIARPGDAVLLSPACASFDMFRSYAERGEHFQAAVAALPGRRV